MNPLTASLSSVTNFLALYFKTDIGFNSLNTARSALSLILPEIENNTIGNHPLVKRIMQGAARVKPPLPRYSFTWDPSQVVTYLSTLYPHESLSLEDMTIKCVTGLSLITAHRTQTLSLIRVNNIQTMQDRLEIYIPDQVKTSKPGRLQPLLIIPEFKDRPDVCVMNSLKSYLRMTENLRTSDFLFIGLSKPHKAIGAQTVSRWIRRGLSKSGIDISKFNAHSVRSSATSAASRGGITLDQIRMRAGWSNQSDTFRNFYNRPIDTSNDFAKSIYGLSDL